MTSVGATQGVNPERAASFSSGGFSNFFAIPSYQAAAVSAFKTRLGSTNAGKFNTTGRGFPDVAAQGVNFQIVLDTQTGGVDGTSCASPLFASIIALVNDRLVAAGKSPMGFLNPFLYSAAGTAALTDITAGTNPGVYSPRPRAPCALADCAQAATRMASRPSRAGTRYVRTLLSARPL